MVREDNDSMSSKNSNAIINAMTVDVEDYFHVSAFEKAIDKTDWNNLALRVEANTYRLLELFEQKQAKCTFLFHLHKTSRRRCKNQSPFRPPL